MDVFDSEEFLHDNLRRLRAFCFASYPSLFLPPSSLSVSVSGFLFPLMLPTPLIFILSPLFLCNSFTCSTSVQECSLSWSIFAGKKRVLSCFSTKAGVSTGFPIRIISQNMTYS